MEYRRRFCVCAHFVQFWKNIDWETDEIEFVLKSHLRLDRSESKWHLNIIRWCGWHLSTSLNTHLTILVIGPMWQLLMIKKCEVSLCESDIAATWSALTSLFSKFRFTRVSEIRYTGRLTSVSSSDLDRMRKCAAAYTRNCKGQIPLRYPGRRQVRGWSQTCRRRGSASSC